jgi:hypothetical protein
MRLNRIAPRTGLALALALVTFGGLPHPTAAQELSDILARYQQAIGGEEAWKAVQSMRRTGTLDLMGGALQAQITVTSARPARMRADIDVASMGVQVVQAFDGTTAWTINPSMGTTEPQVMDPATTEAMLEQADLDGPLIDWQGDGNSVSLAGTETVDGVDAFVLEVTYSTGNMSRYYLDPDTYLVIQVTADRPATGATVTRMGDYRDIGRGLMVPFHVESTAPQGDQEVTWDAFELDVDVDDALFSMAGG